MIIAIDGYSSCGKSTLAKSIAKSLGFVFIDTGAMYRAVTLYFIDHEVNIKDQVAIAEALSNIKITFQYSETDEQLTLLNGQDVSRQIRGISVSDYVSHIAKIPAVREKLVALQRKTALESSIVMDGRDIGTVVFPQAEIKFFVTAALEERVNRRYNELVSKGIDLTKEEVELNLIERDKIDSTRKHSPLAVASDAYMIDNTYLNKEEQLTLALKIIDQLTA